MGSLQNDVNLSSSPQKSLIFIGCLVNLAHQPKEKRRIFLADFVDDHENLGLLTSMNLDSPSYFGKIDV